MKKLLFLPLLLSWVITVLLFKLLNRFQNVPVWNWKGVYLLDSSKDIKFKVEDDTEGSEVEIEIYHNEYSDSKFIFVNSINKDIDTKVYLNTHLSSLKTLKKNVN